MTVNIPQRAPFPVHVQPGKDYFWCRCGNSKSQPFCDGSHKSGPYTPVKFTATEAAMLYFCGCKHSTHPPFCDGTHKTV